MRAAFTLLTLSVFLLPRVAAQNLTIVNGFPSDSAIGPKIVPDNVGAVGNEHVVSLTCANFIVHDKKTGKVLLKKTQTELWDELGFKEVTPASSANDPRMLYDPLSQRWIATTAFDKVHVLLLAVSTSSDPTRPWKGVKIPFKSPDFGFRCGVDKNGFSARTGRLSRSLGRRVGEPYLGGMRA